MKILVDRLTETPTAFAFEADTPWWQAHMPAQRDLPRELEPPLSIQLTGYCMADGDLLLEGVVEGSLELECGRCLGRYRHALHEPFRVVLAPAGEREPADPQAAGALARDGLCLAEDVETGWYRGNTLDLSSVFLEVVALALPVQPLCRGDCAGLCPRCGADRKAGPCGCPEVAASSPFAVLSGLRESLSKGEK